MYSVALVFVSLRAVQFPHATVIPPMLSTELCHREFGQLAHRRSQFHKKNPPPLALLQEITKQGVSQSVIIGGQIREQGMDEVWKHF
jgi:hypothetical protein